MKTIFKIILIVQLFLLSSCGVKRIYTSGSYGSLKSYTAKNEYQGMRSSEIYISGDISTGKHGQEGNSFKDSKTLVSLNTHKSVTGRNYNLYYGLGATFSGLSFGYRFEKYTISLITQSGEADINSIKFGLTYQLF